MDFALRHTREIDGSLVEPATDGDERNLLSRIAARDREAMRDFYFLYHRRLVRLVARITTRRDQVEDIVNEAFGLVWRHAAEFPGDSRVSTWVLEIAWRHGLTSIRRHRGLTAHPSLHAIPPAVETSYPESRNALERAMSMLSPEQRALIELAYVGAYSCEEISAIMKCPASAVRTRLLDARCKLRMEIEAGAAAQGAVAVEPLTI